MGSRYRLMMFRRSIVLFVLAVQVSCVPINFAQFRGAGSSSSRDYFPLVEGASWTYNHSLKIQEHEWSPLPDSTVTIETVEASGDLVVARASESTLEPEFSGTTILGTWDGYHQATNRFSYIKSADKVKVGLEGRLPVMLTWEYLDGWHQIYDGRPAVFFSLPFSGEPVVVDEGKPSPNDKHKEIFSSRIQTMTPNVTVNTEAGEFKDCTEVTQTYSSKASIEKEAFQTTQEASYSIKIWFAPGVGIVKKLRYSEQIPYWKSTAQTTLASYSIPSR